MPRRRATTAAPVVVTVLTVGLLVGGCSTGSPTAAPTTATTANATATVTESATATSTDSSAATATATSTATDPAAPVPTARTATPPPAPTATAPPLTAALPTEFTPMGQVIKDDSLGHEITVLRMARGLPWPEGSSGQSAAFELLALELRLTPGTKYTATLRELDFALITGSQYPNRPDPLIDAQLALAGWALLPTEDETMIDTITAMFGERGRSRSPGAGRDSLRRSSACRSSGDRRSQRLSPTSTGSLTSATPNASCTPSRTVRAKATISAAVALPRLVTARVCLVDRAAGPGIPKPFPKPARSISQAALVLTPPGALHRGTAGPAGPSRSATRSTRVW